MLSRSLGVAALAGLVCFCGCKAAPPGRAEDAVIRLIKHSITVGGKHDKNPVPSTPEKIESWKQTFGGFILW